jgi:hypothetical protein
MQNATEVTRHVEGARAAGGLRSKVAVVVSATLACAAALPVFYLSSAPSEAGFGNEDSAPELGSDRRPEIVRQDFSAARQQLGDRSAATAPEPSDGHVLARAQTATGATLTVFGTSETRDADCTAVFLTEGVPTSVQCGRASSSGAQGFDGILRATLGGQGTEVISGTAPPGTSYVILRSAGGELRVKAFRAGANRGGRTFFVAAWSVAADTALEAFNSGGRSLAKAKDSPFNP